MLSDTIAAIATGMTNSGISIIRISGEDAVAIADSVFITKSGRQILKKAATHTIHYGFIRDENEILDEVMVSVMLSPKSYTMEDVVEINCHGGLFVTKKILHLLLQKGARLAEPGEFTKRAFLNGRIDLSQAEAVMDLIEAKTDFALKSSEEQLQGKVRKKIEALRAELLHELAFIESAIDDPEHISLDGYQDTLLKKIDLIEGEIDALLNHFEDGLVLKNGIKTVIVGKPNVGKSSFLNALVGKERAIVTEIAGTTRDTLEEAAMLRGILLNIIDTAGIHASDDPVEQIGIQKAKEAFSSADLILYVVDSSAPLDEEDDEILSSVKDKKMIVLLNKSDLEEQVSLSDIKERLRSEEIPVLKISSKDNTGFEEFADLIEELFVKGIIESDDEISITNVRHKQSLDEAKNAMQLVRQSLLDDMPEDFYSIDLMSAYESLGHIIGAQIEDDLADEIFSKFCMGK